MKAKSSPLSSNNHHDIGGQCHESIIINESEIGQHHARKRYRRLSPGSRVAEWSKCRSAGSEMPGTQAWSRIGVMIIGNVARCIMMIFIQRMSPIAKAQLNSCEKRIVRLTHAGDAAILICKSWDSLKLFLSSHECVASPGLSYIRFWSVEVFVAGWWMLAEGLLGGGIPPIGRHPTEANTSLSFTTEATLFQLRNSFTAVMYQTHNWLP